MAGLAQHKKNIFLWSKGTGRMWKNSSSFIVCHPAIVRSSRKSQVDWIRAKYVYICDLSYDFILCCCNRSEREQGPPFSQDPKSRSL